MAYSDKVIDHYNNPRNVGSFGASKEVATRKERRVLAKDRAGLDLSWQQMQLVKALKATGKPVAVVLSNGRPLTINWVAANMPAILETWFSGEKSGLAIADVLLGNINPSGKLPMSFPRSVGQIPIYYNHKPTSRHNYVDEQSTPLFAFGHGLSYTKFDYSDLHVSPSTIQVNGKAEISVSVLSGDGGGLLANMNRWRGQVGLAPVAESELDKQVSSLDVIGGKAMLVDMNGQNPETGQKVRLISAIVPREGLTWFYKLMGDEAAAGREKAAFIKFVQSARYPNA